MAIGKSVMVQSSPRGVKPLAQIRLPNEGPDGLDFFPIYYFYAVKTGTDRLLKNPFMII